MELQPVPSWGTIPRMLRDQAAEHGGTVVLAQDGETCTLAELRAKAAEVARGLIALGVAPGDRVAVWAPNCIDWVVTAYGIWDAGAIITPLSTRFKGIEAAELLRKVGAKALFVAEGFMDISYLGMLVEAEVETPELTHLIAYGSHGPHGGGALSWAEFLGGGKGVTAGAAEERALAVGPDDFAEIMATSGTTGTPKGVMLHHAQLLRGYWDWAELVTLTEHDRYPIIAPFSHGFGINAGLLACVLRRATMMPIPLFAPDELMDRIERDRISILAGPPNLFYRILEEMAAGSRDLSSLRVAICGAAAVPPELIRRLLEKVGPPEKPEHDQCDPRQRQLGLERMINAYGLMEGTVVSMTRAEDPVEVIAGTTGRPVPGVSVRIVDDEGEDLPVGERGEILVGGYGVMRGYWQDPVRTAEAIDPDGWLRTGDVGVLDEQGNVAIVDRKKEMFIVGGFNAYPAEIEALLLRHPGLGQVAVVGVPDEKAGEIGWAYVVAQPGAAVGPDEVIGWARDHMSNYKVPRRVIVVDALPVNVNGKVDKLALRARAAGKG